MVTNKHVADAPPTLLAQILIERYGLDGRRPRSIAEVAEKHGLTRLTVRIFEGRLLEHLKSVIASEAKS